MLGVLIFLLIIAILAVVFTLQNSTEITVHLFFWEIANVPLALVLLVCMLIGIIAAAFYFYPRLWKLKSEIRKLKKIIRKTEGLREPEKKPDDDNPEGIAFEEEKGRFSFFKD